MNDRDCERCVHSRPYGGENNNRCTSWDCEFIDRKEAVEAYRWSKALESAPTIDAVEVVRCKECRHWSNGNDTYGICYRCPNTRQMKHDDFCSYGEREGNR